MLTTMIGICESYIGQYPTTLEQDEQLIRDRAMFAALSRQQRMAIRLRASEKRILLQTIKAVQDELQKLPTVVSAEGSEAGAVQAAGRSFDTMASKATVANARSTFDWVDMKGNKAASKKEMEDATSVGSTSPSSSSSSIAERRRRRRGFGDK